MFGGVNVWQIVEFKVIGEIIISEWIDFGHKDTIYKLKFDWSKFANHGRLANFAELFRCQTFLSYGTYNAGALAFTIVSRAMYFLKTTVNKCTYETYKV